MTVGFADQTGVDDIRATIELDTALTGTDPDGTVSWSVADAATGGLGAPTVTLGLLNDFTHVDAADMLNGLGQLAAAIVSSQSTRDLDLPFLQEPMREAVDFAQPLLDFLRQQGEAAVICGRQDGDPPTGGYWNAATGDELWCQAVMLENPATVEWTVEGVSASTDLATAGLNPTATAAVTLGANAVDGVRVEFRLPGESLVDPPAHSVTPALPDSAGAGRQAGQPGRFRSGRAGAGVRSGHPQPDLPPASERWGTASLPAVAPPLTSATSSRAPPA